VLLQRTRGESVADVFPEFMRRWPDPASLGRARVSSITSVIRSLGLAKRAPVLKRLGQTIGLEGVPLEPEALLKLPGVGRYAAHAVPVFSAGRDLPVVDWVIARVLRRYFGLPATRRPNADEELWELARSLSKRGRARELWLGTLDFAAAVCLPRPACHRCPLASSCTFASEAISG
jgi:A/G-specific adenine glycosylase